MQAIRILIPEPDYLEEGPMTCFGEFSICANMLHLTVRTRRPSHNVVLIKVSLSQSKSELPRSASIRRTHRPPACSGQS